MSQNCTDIEDKKCQFQGQGELKLTNGAIRGPGLPQMDNLRGTIKVESKQLTADIKTQTGSGNIHISTEAQLPSNPNLHTEVTLTNVPYVSAGRLTRLKSGKVYVDYPVGAKKYLVGELDNFHIVITPRAVQDLHPIKPLSKVSIVEDIATSKPLKPNQTAVPPSSPVTILVRTKDPIQITGPEVDARAKIDLKIEGNKINGQIEVIPDGRVKVQDNWWDISTAKVLLAGNIPPDPQLQVELKHTYEDGLQLTLALTGSAENPELQLYSEPAKSKEELLNYLIFGVGNSSGSGGLESQASSQAMGMLVGMLQNELFLAFPLDQIDVDMAEDSSVSRVAVGKWLTNRLFVAYGFRPEATPDESKNEVQLKWRLGQGWILEGNYGDNQSVSADVLWTKQFD